MELLILLVQRPGELVSRDEIASSLWGKDVFLDVDHSINTAVAKIRTALRDDPDKPRFVETVVGKGYRFVASVTSKNGASNLQPQHEAPVPASSGPAVPAPLPTTQPRVLSILLLVALVGLALLAAGGALWIRNTEYFWRSPIAEARFQIVTDFDGIAEAAAVSRDGQFVAFPFGPGRTDGCLGYAGRLGTIPQFDAWERATACESLDPHRGILARFLTRHILGSQASRFERQRYRRLGGANARRTAEAIPGRGC